MDNSDWNSYSAENEHDALIDDKPATEAKFGCAVLVGRPALHRRVERIREIGLDDSGFKDVQIDVPEDGFTTSLLSSQPQIATPRVDNFEGKDNNTFDL